MIETTDLHLQSYNAFQIQHNTSSNELVKSLEQANVRITYLEGQLHSITYVTTA